MNGRLPRLAVIVLSEDETRHWHAIFSRDLRELHRAQILERCQSRARQSGSSEFVVYDAYESLVAKGEVSGAI